MPTTPRSIRSAKHLKAMKIASTARAEDGLATQFSESTRLLNQINGLRRFLKENEDADIPEALRQEVKERVQEVLANTAEELYLLSGNAQAQAHT
jgi:protein subunit release factor A